MDGRQEFVEVAQVVLAELAGHVTLLFKQVGNGRIFRLKSDGSFVTSPLDPEKTWDLRATEFPGADIGYVRGLSAGFVHLQEQIVSEEEADERFGFLLEAVRVSAI